MTLDAFLDAGVLDPGDVAVATTLGGLVPGTHADVALAIALATRAPRVGSVCVDLRDIREVVVSRLEESAAPAVVDAAAPAEFVAEPPVAEDRLAVGATGPVDLGALPWPSPAEWRDLLRASPLVRTTGDAADPDDLLLRPLVLDGHLLYLDRFHVLEQHLADDLLARAAAADIAEPTGPATAVLELVDRNGRRLDATQLAAARAGLTDRFVVIPGGPGTGKTTTVARLLAALLEEDRLAGVSRRVRLAAPTGKAAARMTEAVRQAAAALEGLVAPEVLEGLLGLEATTIHRLLGRSPRRVGFLHGPDDPLECDVLVVDETSMVSLALMAHLLSAVAPETVVVLVGDPDQLASVEAGSVLGDVVGTGDRPAPPATLAPCVHRLGTVHRQADDSTVRVLAAAVAGGDADEVVTLLRAGAEDLVWIDPESGDDARSVVEREVRRAARRAVERAEDGDAAGALEEVLTTKVLCGRRRGAGGVEGWNRAVEASLPHGLVDRAGWYPGRPVMVLRNDYVNEVFNGDVGVAVRGDVADRYVVVFPRGADGSELHRVESVRLDKVASQWAMSIHKSQGSEFDHVVVSLPPPPSRILTRELLYTGITRARRRLTVVATEASIRAAVDRPVARATGLAARLAD
ncbi:MAG: exodeoxyribonuclease V subunit alpha [Microthrixaceae bacterium]